MKDEIKITRASRKDAYAVADDKTRKVLGALAAKAATPAPTLSDYTTIRSYEDACVALGESLDVEKLMAAGVPSHIIAQMKLELICKALWGGENKCQPTADGSKVWWYPILSLWTRVLISNMVDESRKAILSASANRGETAGFGCLYALGRGSWMAPYGEFRLCLDTQEKAEYFGRQFVELWAEAYAYNFTVGGHLE